MKSRWFPALAAILGLALFSSLSVPVAAAAPTPVKLALGGTAAIPWAIGNIAPGDSGTNTIALSNTGSRDGFVTIWISDIVNSEGANPESETGDTTEPGELIDYLTLNVSGTSLSADFTLPSKIDNFPLSAADTKYIHVNPLRAFSTVSLHWEWRLPPETGNDVQGDRISLTINYALEEFSAPPPPSDPPSPTATPAPTASPAPAATATPWPTAPPTLIPTAQPIPTSSPTSTSIPVTPQAVSSVVIRKTGPSGLFTGFTRSYSLAVTNTGAVTLTDVTVTDYLPELLSYKSAIPDGSVTGNQIAWNLGTMGIGETKEIVVILGGVKAGAAVNRATVTTREGATSTDSLNIMVLGAPGAHMSLIDSSDPVAVGDQYTYTIKVLNQSTANDIHNMTIVAVAPEETVYISADGATSFTVSGREVRFGAVGTLKPGDTVEFHVTVKATANGAAVFNATMRWDEFGEPIVNQEGTTIFLAPTPISVRLVSPGGASTLGLLLDSSTAKSYTATFFESRLTLQLDANTKIALSNGQPPEQIEVKIAETGSASGEGKVIVGPIYQISAGYDASGNYGDVHFDRPVTITLRYDPAAMPQNNTLLYIAYFEGDPNQPEPDWVRLDYPPDYVPETGQVSGVLRHLAFFAVMAESAPYPPPPAPIPPQAAPADFEVRNLEISPTQPKPGETISVDYEVVNTSGKSGEFTLKIDIPGLLQTSQLIKLEAGEAQAFSVTLPPGNPGTYQVNIGGAKDTFSIGTSAPGLAAPLGIPGDMSAWLMPAILSMIGAAALVFYIAIIMMRRREDGRLLPAPAPANVQAQTAKQRTLYATRHQKRVAELAGAIAREMNLSEKLVGMLLGVGIIHASGSAELPYPVAQTALQYHVRLNGSGYPQKLAGDDILLEARILAVADAAETMSSPRPLRPAIDLAKTLEQIKRNSSTLYDSGVVKAFASLVDRGQFRFQTSYD